MILHLTYIRGLIVKFDQDFPIAYVKVVKSKFEKFYQSVLLNLHVHHLIVNHHDKNIKISLSVRKAKTQISLGIR